MSRSRRARKSPSAQKYTANDVRALAWFELYQDLLDGDCHPSVILDFMLLAEGTVYDCNLHEYVRFEIFERDLASNCGHYKYYTKDGRCHHFDVQSKEDAIELFHNFVMEQDQLQLPTGDEYLAYGTCVATAFLGALAA